MEDDLRIGARSIRGLIEDGETLRVLDVRGSAAYRRSDERVTDDLRTSAREVTQLADRLERSDWILAYCT